MKLVARDVTFRYSADGQDVLSKLSFTAEAGSYWCVAGPNGSGKSTFLKIACGLISAKDTGGALSGEIHWEDRPLADWDRLTMAREIAFVPGTLKTQFPVSVEEFVVQGRFARSTLWSRHTKQDNEIAARAMERVGIASHANDAITRLSAGETQLALIARALAQESKVIVLDESTANLDLAYQARIFELLAELNAQKLTVLIVSHDLNLAAEFCPNVLWLRKGASYAQGPMTETLTTDLVRELYESGDRIRVGKNPFTSRPKVFIT